MIPFYVLLIMGGTVGIIELIESNNDIPWLNDVCTDDGTDADVPPPVDCVFPDTTPNPLKSVWPEEVLEVAELGAAVGVIEMPVFGPSPGGAPSGGAPPGQFPSRGIPSGGIPSGGVPPGGAPPFMSPGAPLGRSLVSLSGGCVVAVGIDVVLFSSGIMATIGTLVGDVVISWRVVGLAFTA
jgi:hypothetical protein